MRRPSQQAAFSKKEISHLFKTARRTLQQAGLNILLAPKTKEFGRILVVTAAKIGTSPERNRIRRRLKAIFYEKKLFENSYDCVVIVKKEGVDLGHQELTQLLLQAFEQIKTKSA